MKQRLVFLLACLVPLCLAFAPFLLTATGCAIFKSNACQALKLAADACPYVIIHLPDGTSEAVPKRRIEEVTEATRAARISGQRQGAPDGGSE